LRLRGASRCLVVAIALSVVRAIAQAGIDVTMDGTCVLVYDSVQILP
jgi:hypothetical protein